jgi:hypothetical protein
MGSERKGRNSPDPGRGVIRRDALEKRIGPDAYLSKSQENPDICIKRHGIERAFFIREERLNGTSYH